MAKKLFTAIIYCNQTQTNGNFFLKFRNISCQDKFCKFAKKFNGAAYINFYDKETRTYLNRVYLN
jgi:hypothetical protein